ncbi:uncharacterized protein LOC142987008 isoform X2 [Anticarsia gemmatalis]|uniref:uncharacterized protein LOC142987008 isoform X2 n=1 Tax=Anticarsia gemmatalis TaxID=129554 RepID=UPI003F776B20
MPSPCRRRADAAQLHCRYESREARHRAAAAPPPRRRRNRARSPPSVFIPFPTAYESARREISRNANMSNIMKKKKFVLAYYMYRKWQKERRVKKLWVHPMLLAREQYETQSRSSRKAVKRRSSKDHLDLNEHGGPSSPPEKKPRARENGRVDDSDDDDEASEFLRLEKEKLDSTQRIADSLQTIRSEISRLANIMDHIRDVISNNRIHL